MAASTRLAATNGFSRASTASPRAGCSRRMQPIVAASAASVDAGVGERVGRLAAETDEDDRRAARRQVAEHGDDERAPQRQVAAQLMRVALDREAAERERRIEEEHALADPAVGDLGRRLEVDAAGLDVGDQPLPVGGRARIARRRRCAPRRSAACRCGRSSRTSSRVRASARRCRPRRRGRWRRRRRDRGPARG